MEALRDTKIGRILVSSDDGLTLEGVQAISGTAARFQKKPADYMLSRPVKESAEAAALETVAITPKTDGVRL